jgi:hypothetical protein
MDIGSQLFILSANHIILDFTSTSFPVYDNITFLSISRMTYQSFIDSIVTNVLFLELSDSNCQSTSYNDHEDIDGFTIDDVTDELGFNIAIKITRAIPINNQLSFICSIIEVL